MMFVDNPVLAALRKARANKKEYDKYIVVKSSKGRFGVKDCTGIMYGVFSTEDEAHEAIDRRVENANK